MKRTGTYFRPRRNFTRGTYRCQYRSQAVVTAAPTVVSTCDAAEKKGIGSTAYSCLSIQWGS